MAKYISKYTNLRLVRKSSFTKEIEGQVVVVPGKSVQFDNGLYETNNPSEIKFLEEHPNFGDAFIRIDSENIEEAKKGLRQTLTEKEEELKAKEAELKEREKALAEGEGVPKTRAEKETKKAEKPKF